MEAVAFDGKWEFMKRVEANKLVSMSEGEPCGIEERIARLEDRSSIGELLAHYARCVDVHDAGGVSAAFTSDGIICAPGLRPVAGRARICKLYDRLLSCMESSLHLIGSQQVLFETSDCAVVHAPFYAWDSYSSEADPDCFSYGFYEMKALREADGEWRIAVLNVHFSGQIDKNAVPYPGGRAREQFNRPWPPVVFE